MLLLRFASWNPHASGRVDSRLALSSCCLICRLGRRILRPLLRSEIGEVANRRAWFDVSKLTPEVLQLYKQPLKVQGWDLALLEVSLLRRMAVFVFLFYVHASLVQRPC